MTTKQAVAMQRATDDEIRIYSPALVVTAAILLFAVTAISLSLPFERFDLSAKIEQAMVQKPHPTVMRAGY